MDEYEFNLGFVKEIEKYEYLYNYTLPAYSRKDFTEKAWSEIGQKFNLTIQQCKEKWKKLRAVFSRDLKPPKNGSRAKRPYYLADAMKFVIPYVNLKKSGTKSNIPLIEEYEESLESSLMVTEPDSDSIQTESLSLASEFSQTAPVCKTSKKRKTNDDCVEYLHTKKSKQEKELTSKEESIKLFLLSLQQELNEMSNPQIRIFKIKVLQLINRIMTSGSNNSFEIIEECYGN